MTTTARPRQDTYRESVVIEWDEEIREQVPLPPPHTGHTSRWTGNRRLRATVEIIIDLAALARTLGVTACHAKTKRAVEAKGKVRVTCLSEPVEISKTMRPTEGGAP